MPTYYGTITITIRGWFDADGIEEILEYPIGCASNYTIKTKIVDMKKRERIVADGKLICYFTT